MSGNVLVVGSLNLDLVVSAPSIPRPGQTVLGTDFQMFPGGKGANQAVSAARQNASTAMVGRIGKDEFGERLLESLHTSGVGTEFVAVDPDLSTGVAFICVDEAGENAIVVAPGANNGCAIEHLPGAIWEQTDVVLLQLEIPLGTVTKAAAYAREHEALVILDPAPPQVLPRNLLENVDILVPNSSEAAVLAGMDDPVTEANVQEVAEKLLSLGPKQVIVKLGADGAFLWGQYAKERVYGIPVESVDTTAAGDCYAGALGACLARGATLLEAARYANVAAAIAVTRKGAQSSMPTSSEVETFIDKLK
ncbi:MAG: ribokinase [Limnochordia bacterium]|nr:ribokinase [Limnochordia bacterium]MDD2628589.1 ribokinase [Limnochordia bacterium]MDD4517341.1 ribokinase [Limnochordia bacterium]